MTYEIILSTYAKKDLKKVNNSHFQKVCIKLFEIIRANPFKNPPPYEKITSCGDLKYSRRINIQHRLFYEVDEKNKRVKILRMRSHYGDN